MTGSYFNRRIDSGHTLSRSCQTGEVVGQPFEVLRFASCNSVYFDRIGCLFPAGLERRIGWRFLNPNAVAIAVGTSDIGVMRDRCRTQCGTARRRLMCPQVPTGRLTLLTRRELAFVSLSNVTGHSTVRCYLKRRAWLGHDLAAPILLMKCDQYV